MAKRTSYEVIITKPAARRYQEEILNYILQHFSLDRVLEINELINKLLESLEKMPERGAQEPQLEHKNEDYRFILFKQSRNLELKVVYFTDERKGIVYVTDFFPVLMKHSSIRG